MQLMVQMERTAREVSRSSNISLYGQRTHKADGSYIKSSAQDRFISSNISFCGQRTDTTDGLDGKGSVRDF